MRALIVYESMYGSTRRIATAIAAGLRDSHDVELVAAVDAPQVLRDVDLLIVGGPTHIHGVASAASRRAAAKSAADHGTPLDPSATASPGVREWLGALDKGAGVRAAAFDTRIHKAAWLTGSAARGIARRLRSRGYEVAAVESFFVDDSEGPLGDEEENRARAWAAGLASGAPSQV